MALLMSGGIGSAGGQPGQEGAQQHHRQPTGAQVHIEPGIEFHEFEQAHTGVPTGSEGQLAAFLGCESFRAGCGDAGSVGSGKDIQVQ